MALLFLLPGVLSLSNTLPPDCLLAVTYFSSNNVDVLLNSSDAMTDPANKCPADFTAADTAWQAANASLTKVPKHACNRTLKIFLNYGVCAKTHLSHTIKLLHLGCLRLP